jgi:hypothetical protein
LKRSWGSSERRSPPPLVSRAVGGKADPIDCTHPATNRVCPSSPQATFEACCPVSIPSRYVPSDAKPLLLQHLQCFALRRSLLLSITSWQQWPGTLSVRIPISGSGKCSVHRCGGIAWRTGLVTCRWPAHPIQRPRTSQRKEFMLNCPVHPCLYQPPHLPLMGRSMAHRLTSTSGENCLWLTRTSAARSLSRNYSQR